MPSVPPDPAAEILDRLRRVCEAHDPAIGPHLDRVAELSATIARGLGRPPAEVQAVRQIAPLHDLGKIALPLSLLQKEGALSTEEMDEVKAHTVVGYDILRGSAWPLVQAAARVALSHHENWDGSGYPHGLRGTAIPLEARIVAVADVFDALTSQRSYKPAWHFEAALAEMERLRAAKFDPAILDVFLTVVREPRRASA